ncbi:MAG: minichromosome maintenance protein MCM, partial [Nanoarchaeota archaeon]
MDITKKKEFEIEAKQFFEAHKKEVGKSIREKDKIVRMDFDQLARFSPAISEKLLESPEDITILLENALDETGLVKNPRIRFMNLPATASIKIKEIRAKHLDQFIAIEGIVRQASDVRPQVVNARFECPTCGAILSVLQIDRKFREPSRCSCGRKGLFKLLSKEMVDAQRLVIEESPDSLDGGEQPRRMSVFLKEDLVDPKMEDRTTPGSKVRIIGVLKEVPVPLPQGSISTRFDLAVEANNAIPLEETFDDLEINEEDENKIKELASNPKVFELLVSSIVPSVYGFKEVKEAILLQLFSGIRKKKSDGGSTRGDIHVLLVGDPGVAKSVTLKFVSGIAPKGRYVSGKAATAAGLTAAVVKDEFLRGWSLEAGAMVLSNKGTICIDEIEKMDEQDRSTMHEAMEQQTVTISKANIQASLRAETSVLAAGNPKFGRFDPLIPIPQQINISPALLSRFDVIFILR